MGFFSRLFRKADPSNQITCPRCLGKGHVDQDDIIRLNQQGKWRTGTCAYCKGTGEVNKEILAKVAPDARHLTTDLTEKERDAVVNATKLDGCPVSEYNRLWLENAFSVLLDFFGKENIQQRKVLIPHYADFPVLYDKTEQSAYETMKIVASQMEVPFENIELNFYDDRVTEISSGSPFGTDLYLESVKGDHNAQGFYMGMRENGKYEIWVSRNNLVLPERLVAILAHEIAHIKLLGEKRRISDNEYLTDLTTVVFGLGIFNANEAFQSWKDKRTWGYTSLGYLSQMQWGYSLALFAYVRGESAPAWSEHLAPNVKSDFQQGQRFIEANKELIFQDNAR